MLLALLASAEELKSDRGNYSMVIPSGWTVTFQNSDGFSITSPEKSKTITLIIQNADFATLDSNSVASTKREFLETGSQEISSKNFLIDGVPAYEIVGRIGKIRFASSFIFQMMLANDKLYCLHVGHIGGDVLQDSEMQQAITSFHFLKPPKPSPSSSFGKFTFFGLVVLGTIMVGIIIWWVKSPKAHRI